VLDALAAAARGCPEVREDAEPEIAFENAGAVALEFSVSAELAEGISARRAETALRTAVVRTLRRRNIALAGHDHGLPTRDLEHLRTLLHQLGEETSRPPQAVETPKAK
jgi:small-conductance mechanosensitive channel